MTPKKTILKTLSTSYRNSGPGVLTRPATIPGFQAKPEKYQQAVNSLLQERLIEGTKDQEGRMAITLNDQKMADVRKHLRPLWFHPAIVALLGLLAVAAGYSLIG